MAALGGTGLHGRWLQHRGLWCGAHMRLHTHMCTPRVHTPAHLLGEGCVRFEPHTPRPAGCSTHPCLLHHSTPHALRRVRRCQLSTLHLVDGCGCARLGCCALPCLQGCRVHIARHKAHAGRIHAFHPVQGAAGRGRSWAWLDKVEWGLARVFERAPTVCVGGGRACLHVTGRGGPV